ncbi:hypothetical protein RUND412_003909 [Rhizina undulata]
MIRSMHILPDSFQISKPSLLPITIPISPKSPMLSLRRFHSTLSLPKTLRSLSGAPNSEMNSHPRRQHKVAVRQRLYYRAHDEDPSQPSNPSPYGEPSRSSNPFPDEMTSPFLQRRQYHVPSRSLPKTSRAKSRWGGYSPTHFSVPPPPVTFDPRYYNKVAPENPAVATRPTPKPLKSYLALSSIPSKRLPAPQKLLIILDLNGTLLHRPGRRAHSGSLHPVLRPGLKVFLDYLFNNFSVMVWSSAQPKNVDLMVNVVFTAEQRKSLMAVWARDTLGLTKNEFNQKTVVYKRLDRVWVGEHVIAYPYGCVTKTESTEIETTTEVALSKQEGRRWDQRNSLLIDDTAIKAAAQPFNHVELSEFTATSEQLRRDSTLWECMGYLEEAKWADNVSAFVQERPFVVGSTEWKEKGLEVVRAQIKEMASGMTKQARRKARVDMERVGVEIAKTARNGVTNSGIEFVQMDGSVDEDTEMDENGLPGGVKL